MKQRIARIGMILSVSGLVQLQACTNPSNQSFLEPVPDGGEESTLEAEQTEKSEEGSQAKTKTGQFLTDDILPEGTEQCRIKNDKNIPCPDESSR